MDYSNIAGVMQEVQALINAEQQTFKPSDYLAGYPAVPELSFEVPFTTPMLFVIFSFEIQTYTIHCRDATSSTEL